MRKKMKKGLTKEGGCANICKLSARVGGWAIKTTKETEKRIKKFLTKFNGCGNMSKLTTKVVSTCTL